VSDTLGIRPSASNATRTGLEKVGDHLIPEAHGMPSAGTMGVGTSQLDVVLASRPDLSPLLERAFVDAEIDDIGAFLSGLEAGDPEAYGAVTLAIVAGYYMHPEVHRLIGYPGQVAKDVQRMSEREIYQEGLMDLAQKVVERGPIYRPTPTTDGRA
jgi:hypothetical protein